MIKRIAGLIVVTGALVAMAFAVPPAGDATAGKAVFGKKCKMCHGDTGEGNPGMAKALKVTFKPLGSEEVQKKTDAELKKIITDGTGKMKPIKDLSEADLDNVIAFVRTLKK